MVYHELENVHRLGNRIYDRRRLDRVDSSEMVRSIPGSPRCGCCGMNKEETMTTLGILLVVIGLICILMDKD